MEIVKQEFKINYEVSNQCLVRSQRSGVLQNGVKYNASVKLTARNVYESFNESTNFTDTKDVNLTFKINCTSDVECGSLALKIKEYFKSNQVLKLTGSIPTLQNNEYISTVDISYDDLMKYLVSNTKK